MILSILLIFFCIRLVSLRYLLILKTIKSRQLQLNMALKFRSFSNNTFNLCIGWCRHLLIKIHLALQMVLAWIY